jgi:putative ABC transport system substrate-binding protein
MRRREFITLLGGAAIAWPLAARAQQRERMRRIGILVSGTEADANMQERLTAFKQGLEQLGWIPTRNLEIDYRYSGGHPERVPALAKELVALHPDLIFAHTTPAVKALQGITKTIPIVFINVSDPTGAGVIASLARPGANITGILKEISPGATRAALMANPRATAYEYFVRSAKQVAPALHMELVPAHISDAADIERSMEALGRERGQVLAVLPDGTNILHRELITGLAARHRIPTVYAFRFFVTAGGLMSYGTDIIEQNRQAASYVDRILRGQNPADLPVQAPTKYETVLNLKAAKALGFDVPPTLLVRADEVIE